MNEDAEVRSRPRGGKGPDRHNLFLTEAVPEDELPQSKDYVELPDQIYHGTRYD